VDGFAVFDALRASESGASMPPVIMMTSQGSESIAVEAMKVGLADYMTKNGLTASAFQRAIKYAVERWKLRSSLTEKHHRLAHANAELKKRAAELQRVYHAVSHELKTPLTAVREFIALVLGGVAAPVPVGENKMFLELALDGCDQIARHVNDLVDSTRLDVHKLTLDCQNLTVDRVIAFAMASIRETAHSKSIRLEMAVAPQLPMVRADHVRFTQILGNILGNAVKFTGNDGVIQVAARIFAEDPRFVEIAVTDNGCGIPAEHLGHVFDRLFQVPHAGDELMGSGLGLGLSIAKELVALHGGQLSVKSTLGAGSTFSFTLPSVSTRAAVAA
jgi:signal transduction histidine kinase